MAVNKDLDDLNESLKDFDKTGKNLNQVLEDVIAKSAEISTQVRLLSNDSIEALQNSAKASKKLSEILERVKRGSISNREINNQLAKSQDRINKLSSETTKLEERYRNAKGKAKKLIGDQIELLKIAEEGEKKILETLTIANEKQRELSENAGKFYEKISQILGAVPGLGGLSNLFGDIAKNIKQSVLEGGGLIGTLTAIGTAIGALGFALIAKAAFDVNQEITEFGKNLNLSKEEAIELKGQFADISENVNDAAINSVRLGKANVALNNQLGTAVVFSGEILTTFSKLTEVAGISAEAASSLAFQAQRAGKPFREIEENTLAASYSLQRAYGVQLNQREVLEATGKVTGRVRANLGANPEAIARAVTQAKLFGAELDDIVKSSEALLDFENSIEAELRAELLTGKQLNLERARALALAGDQEGLARELQEQAGTFTEFTKLNVLQQKELASAFGMSSDQLSDILFKQETQNMNAKQLRAMGKDELADRLEQVSAQEKLALASEKFMVLLGEVAVILTPIIEGFASLVSNATLLKSVMTGLVAVTTFMAIKSIVTAIASLYTSLGLLGPIGVGLAAAAVAGMFATMASAKQKVADGIAPASKGPFTITDRYGAMAVTTQGDNLAVSPNVNKAPQTQPIVINNTFSNFKSAAYNQLANTQLRQATPTFI
jgi:hypothetical protein